MVTKTKCLICDERPAVIGVYCRQCSQQLKAEKHPRHRTDKAAVLPAMSPIRARSLPCIDLGNGMGKYTPANLQPDKLPRARTIDLNTFCPQLTKEEVKRLKRLVISLTGERLPIGGSYEKSKA